ncbi:hypothetical protein SynPROSU1_02079 [Synechococcus sp. PROS-U-1]|nr:hypothetical protein SynPROSU1_02079 [Synechococcus sp. PROS-U-1]
MTPEMVCASKGTHSNDTDHTPLKTMTFTFKFSSKAFAGIGTKEDAYQKKYDAKISNKDSGNESDQAEEETSIMGGHGSDMIYFTPGQEDSSEPEDNSAENEAEATIISGDGTDTICFGDECFGSRDQDNEETESSGEESSNQDTDSGIDRIAFYDAEKASYIDSWNYDAVNWYSKSDQLAVQDALENQLIAVDVVGF